MKDENSEIQDYDYNRDFENAYGTSDITSMSQQSEQVVEAALPLQDESMGAFNKDLEEPVAEVAPEATATATMPMMGEEEATGPISIPKAILGGVIGTIACALIWTLITVITKYQIGYIALGIGFVVGYLVQRLGNGNNLLFGLIGGIFSLIACVVGDLFSMIVFVADEYNESYFTILSGLSFSDCIYILQNSIQPMSIFFYAIAGYTGFKFAFKK